jgi:hypothetical protein
MSKPFSKSLYETNDGAKHQIVTWLKTQGFKAWINPDQYGIDVLADKNSKRYEFEVEVKHNWRGKTFPYDEIDFPSRKLKVAKSTLENFFVMLNHERNSVLVISGKTFLSSPIIQKDTIYTKNESFVRIPTNQAKFFDLPDEALLDSRNDKHEAQSRTTKARSKVK